MASKISDLKNSLSRLTERVDVYTKGGRMVPLPDRSVIEKKIDPKGKGAERGKERIYLRLALMGLTSVSLRS